jgi:DNA-binding NtrC family response regulator
MSAKNREKWLILDDCATDRKRLMLAIQDADIELIPASTVTEALELLTRREINVCIADFFLRGTNSRHLITNIRHQFPGIPVVVVSGHAGQEDSIYQAGADVVIPKVADIDTFAAIVRNAVSHAKALRANKISTSADRKIRLALAVEETIKNIAESSTGHILITSDPGMGRTAMAQHLAQTLIAKLPPMPGQESHWPSKIATFACTADEPFEVTDAILFGTTRGTPGLIESSQNGVVIIEDAQWLQPRLLEKLKELARREKSRSHSGTDVLPSAARLIFTAIPTDDQKFKETIAKLAARFEIRLPRFTEMLSESRQIIDFLFARCSGKRIKPDKKLLSEILDRVHFSSDRVTLRSLVRCIEAACQRAADDGRQIAFVSDLENFEVLYDSDLRVPQKQSRHFDLAIDDDIGIEPWKQLYEIGRNGTVAEAEELLRKIMIDYAMIRHEGNKTQMAAQLGISRQHLYKPCLRLHHLEVQNSL